MINPTLCIKFETNCKSSGVLHVPGETADAASFTRHGVFGITRTTLGVFIEINFVFFSSFLFFVNLFRKLDSDELAVPGPGLPGAIPP